MIAIQVSSFGFSLTLLWGLLSFGQLQKHMSDSAARTVVLKAAVAQSKIARWIGIALMAVGVLFLIVYQDWTAFTFVLLASSGLCVGALSTFQAGRVIWAGLVESGCNVGMSKRKTLLEAVALTVGSWVLLWMDLI